MKQFSSGLRNGTIPVLLTLTLAAVGCGPGYELAPVSGSVTVDGVPLAQGKIQFFPTEGRSATGRIENGQIRDVSTFDHGDGALVGDHRVAIYAFVREPVGMEIVPWAIPQSYGDPSTSGLTTRIEASGTVLKLALNTRP